MNDNKSSIQWRHTVELELKYALTWGLRCFTKRKPHAGRDVDCTSPALSVHSHQPPAATEWSRLSATTWCYLQRARYDACKFFFLRTYPRTPYQCSRLRRSHVCNSNRWSYSRQQILYPFLKVVYDLDVIQGSFKSVFDFLGLFIISFHSRVIEGMQAEDCETDSVIGFLQRVRSITYGSA